MSIGQTAEKKKLCVSDKTKGSHLEDKISLFRGCYTAAAAHIHIHRTDNQHFLPCFSPCV